MGVAPAVYPDIINTQTIWHILPVGLFVTDHSGCIVEANDRMRRYFPVNGSELKGSQFGDVFGCHSVLKEKAPCGTGSRCPACPMRRAITRVLEGGSDLHEAELQHEFLINNRRSVKWFAVNASRIVQQGRVYAIVALTDISSRKKREKELVQLGITDALTGLYNRRFILQKLKNSLRSKDEATYPVSIVMLDIDDFKHINDTFGHPAGDLVLSGLADIFQKCTRDTDYAGRYGGEEFLLIFENSTAASTRKILVRIAERFRNVLKNEGQVQLTFSAGVTEVLRGQAREADAAALIQKVDQLMYEAKRSGKNRIAL